MKIISYVVAAIGVVGILVGVYLKVGGHHHGFTAIGIGAVVLVLGLIGAFVLKPKAQAA
jgi:hypothetical protein